MNKKVSELVEATNIGNEDILMIIQSGQNKKAKIEKLLPKKTEIVTLENIIFANTDYVIPLSYRVR